MLHLAAPLLLLCAQDPLTDTLVLDINTTPSFGAEFDPEPRAIAAFPDGRLLFTAQADFPSPRTHWVTDGTAAGTSQLLDGSIELRELDGLEDQGGSPGAALPDGRLVFGAEALTGQARPYVTDGTLAGTLALPEVSPQFGLPGPRCLTSHRDEVWYLETRTLGSLSDIELFATDGSIPGTSKRAELPLSPGGVAEGDALLLASDGDELLIAHSWVAESGWVTDLWRSAGSSPSTVLLTTLSGRMATGDSGQPHGSALVLLLGPDPQTPPDKLWSIDLGAGTADLLFDGQPLAFVKGGDERLFFATGSAGSWTLFARQSGGENLALGLYSRLSNPVAGAQPSDAALVDGVLLFGGEGAGSGAGLEPWRSDGTVQGTALLGDLESGRGDSLPHGFAARPGEAYFGATASATGSELYRATDDLNAVSLVADLTPGREGGLSGGRMVALSGSTVYFGYRFEEQGEQLAAGDASGIGLAAEIGAVLNETSLPQRMVSFRERLLFVADDGIHGTEPWISDGTPEGTRILLDVQPGPEDSSPASWVEFQGRLWFPADTEEEGYELWSTDGTSEGTALFLDTLPGPQGAVFKLLANERWLCWMEFESGVGENLWRTDGTLSGTEPIPDLGMGATQGGGAILRVDGDRALVHAVDYSPGAPDVGRELYLVDLTDGSRQLLIDYHAGPLNSAIDSLASTPEFTLMLFDVPGTRLIVSDGTVAGSYELTSPDFPPSLSGTQVLGAWNGLVFFVAPGIGLWRTDGTTAGTFQVASAQALSGAVLQFDGRGRYAMVQDNLNRLWRSDGTQDGTYSIAGPFPPSAGFIFTYILRSPAGTEGTYLFASTEAATGDELWITDGDPGSERLLVDIRPGPNSGAPGQVLRVGTHVFFSGNDGVTSRELHALPFTATGASVLQLFGSACSTTDGANALSATGPATLGSTVIAQLTAATPGATALLFRSATIGSTDLGAGCTLYALEPIFTAAFPLDAQGSGTTALPIPSTPELVGLRLALQAAVPEPAGPFAGAFGLSNALELIVGP